MYLACQVLRVIEGWEFKDLRVRQGLKDPWAHLDNQVSLESESQANQVCQASQESQEPQVGMVLQVTWDHRDLRDTQVPQV